MPVSADVLRAHIDYTAWASLRLLKAAAQLPREELTRDFHTADRTIPGSLAHIFAADRLWLARLSGASASTFLTDGDREMAFLQSAWPALLERWQAWAGALTDERASAQIAYRDMRGNPWSRPLWQLVLHVVNHGTHHRGQISGFLRSLGRTPPPLDLVHFYRDRETLI